MTNLQIDLSMQQVMSTFNGFSTTTDVKKMLELKDFSALDMRFPFIDAFLGRATGYERRPVLTKKNKNILILSPKYYMVHQKYVD